MNPGGPEERSISEQASYWLDAPENGEDLAGFREWVRSSPEHAREFASLAMMRGLARELHPVGNPRLTRLIRISGDSANVTTLGEQAGRSPARQEPERRRRFGLAHAIAAAVVLIALAVILVPLHLERRGWTEYNTIESGAEMVHLSDGSVMYLSPRSRIDVQISGSVRLARFYEGEVLFKIQKRRDSRFRVRVDGGEIDVLGTQFRVRHERGQSGIRVFEGKVQVTGSARAGQARQAIELAAGQSARLGFDGRIERGTDSAAAGAANPVAFDEQPLQEVVELFNRRNPTPQFIVEPGVKDVLFSAILAPTDTTGLIAILRDMPEFQVIDEGHIVRIRRRTDTDVSDQAAND